MSTIEIPSAAPDSSLLRHRRAAPEQARISGPLHRPLMSMVVAMSALVACSFAGVVFDDRMLLGESVWVKPLKFGFAFALYGLTLAWLLALPHRGSRATWWLGTTFAITGFADVGFIALQAARGTYSHFNNHDTDAVNVIGQQIFMSGVPGLFLANLVIVLILSWQKLVDRPTTRAIHAGLALAVLGMAQAYLMGFTGTQRVLDADGNSMELVAGHTVLEQSARTEAARDESGLPIIGWSTVGGDLRIPHFLGLHGIQVLLLAVVVLAWLAPRYAWLRAERTRAALIGVLALGYTGLFAVTFFQAMRAQALLRPDGITLACFGGVLAGTGLLGYAVYQRAQHGAAVR
ncbi:hypothetical protein ACWDYH_28575 [Nocardia goodfellowii]